MPGKYTLWDHAFETPSTDLGAQDTPGGADYGHWRADFGPVPTSGGTSGADVEKIFEDNARTVGLFPEQERGSFLTSESDTDQGALLFRPGDSSDNGVGEGDVSLAGDLTLPVGFRPAEFLTDLAGVHSDAGPWGWGAYVLPYIEQDNIHDWNAAQELFV